MDVLNVYSIKAIEHQYSTGEEPVLVVCSDMRAYICKYMRSSASAYKLACELIGARFAKIWKLNSPEFVFVNIKPEHWIGRFIQHSTVAPAVGYRRIVGVMDITPSVVKEVAPTDSVFRQLLKIALYDFWVANEDRNANNANLLYDIANEQLVSIDYGCILNTSTFDYPMSQLTSTDTILWSDLFNHVSNGRNPAIIEQAVADLKKNYRNALKKGLTQIGNIAEEIPKEWHVPSSIVKGKLQQLFSQQWADDVWDNFLECLYENVRKS